MRTPSCLKLSGDRPSLHIGLKLDRLDVGALGDLLEIHQPFFNLLQLEELVVVSEALQFRLKDAGQVSVVSGVHRANNMIEIL